MKPLDLLLVNAPSRIGVYGALSKFAAIEQPVWALLIARYCLNRGFSVEVLDAEAEELNTEETAAKVVERNPRLATFCIYGHQPSASTQCLPAASAVCSAMKQMAKYTPLGNSIATLALGTHPSALPERTLREEPFDYVCQGEGHTTIVELLNDLQGYDKGAGFQSQTIPGLWYKRDGQILRSAIVPTNAYNLDEDLPNQAWELLDMKRYRPHHWHKWMGDPKGGYATIQTSLGCPWKCHFCCINTPFGGSGYRMWSPANVAAQIANLVNQYSITNIKIADEMFVLNRQHVWQICNHLIDMKLGDRLNIWAYARIDTVKDQRLLDHMRKAGFKDLGIGIESASKHVRDGVEKGRFGNEQILEAVKRVNVAGIHVGANFIFGLPDDTLESMKDTFDLACEINAPYTNLYCAMAYPGSPLHTTAREKGWLLPEDFIKCHNCGREGIYAVIGGPSTCEDCNGAGETSVGWLGYSQHAYETLPLPTETLTAAEVLAFRDEAFMKFHQRPEYLGMLQAKFGDQAVKDMKEILAHGKPKRRLLGD